jgi:SAM-dependent methyltransferase
VARPSEVFRVLRPDGRFVFADPDARRSPNEPATSSGYPRWGEADYRRMFEDAGFTDIGTRHMKSPMGGDCLLVGCRKAAGPGPVEAVETSGQREPVASAASA